MFSHVTVGTNDLNKAERFYDAVLAPLKLVQRQVVHDGGPKALCWVHSGQSLPRFYVYEPFDGALAGVGNGAMIAFAATSPAEVNDAHAAAIATGGTDAGPPGPRPHDGQGYYGAYARDPEGNKIHVVYRRDLT